MSKKFYIGPLTTGLQKNVSPFMIADDAFERLENAYIYRGTVRKRFGSDLMVPSNGVVVGYESLVSRLRFKVGATNANGDLTVAAIPGTTFTIGAMLSVSDGTNVEVFTVKALGLPATLLTTGASTTHTLDTTTGNLVIVGSIADSDVYYYPSLPVMGLVTRETKNINNEPLYAFDLTRSYSYGVDGWDALDATTWACTETSFFSSETFRGVTASDDTLFVTNNVVADGIKFWDTDTSAWIKLNPLVTAAGTIEAALIVKSFGNRLLLFNTTEVVPPLVSKVYQSRVRWCAFGNPLSTIAVPTNAWREDIPGQGGFLDCPTQEVIVAVEHFKDRLIIFCERSTWELVYTANQLAPFLWQRISSELGVESTFSQVPFDQAIIGFGNVGLHACDGNSVRRIDEKIPDEAYNVHNVDGGVKRVCAIRDYNTEQVYFSYPSASTTALNPYPDEILVYSYNTQAWSIFHDSVTSWGYVQEGLPAGYIKESRHVIGGNQEGFVFIVNKDKTTNTESLQITDMTYMGAFYSKLIIKDHNLNIGDWIKIKNCVGSTTLNDMNVNVRFLSPSDANEVTVLHLDTTPVGTYKGAGTATRVSKIDILTKQYNFFLNDSLGCSFSDVSLYFKKDNYGLVDLDYSTSSTSLSMNTDAFFTDTLLGDGKLSFAPDPLLPLEASQTRLWRKAHISAQGDCIQLRMSYNFNEMNSTDFAEADFNLFAMIFTADPTSYL